MLRVFLVLAAIMASAGPVLADDMEACRDKQTEAKARLEACEKVIAAGQASGKDAPGKDVSGKDLALAYAVRGQAFRVKRNYDKAIAAFSAAHDADPDDPVYVNARGFAYEQKGDDDHAMADYNLVLKMRWNFAGAFYNRGTLYMRKGALQSARRFQRRTENQAGILSRARRPRAGADHQQGFRRRAGGFCRSRTDRPGRNPGPGRSLSGLYRDGQVRSGPGRLQQRD
jgi:Flp pilus assembly protein TadD